MVDMMRMINTLLDPDKRFEWMAFHGLTNSMSDEEYLKKKFRIRIGYPLNLDEPRSFNEKIQWLKLHDHNPDYVTMVDKCDVKSYVASVIGEEYIIPTLGVWERFDDIDFKGLPGQFVLKCTHDSGGLVICKDKARLDMDAARKKIEGAMRNNYFYLGREWPYKQVRPRIIAETYISDERDVNASRPVQSVEELRDYKLMCFNGKVKCSFVCTDRFSGTGLKVTFFDRDWHRMPFNRHYPASELEIGKPHNYEKMVALAERLSQDIPFVRVDFYEPKGQIYFGEMTFYPGSGFEEFTPVEWDYTLGGWIQLPNG